MNGTRSQFERMRGTHERKLARRRFLIAVAAVSAVATLDGQRAYPQSYPTKPLRLLIGAAAGSTPDILARLVSEQLSRALEQPVVVENRAGPGGIAAMQALVTSAPDGYTLALATVNQAVLNSYLFSNLPYDPFKDLEPISVLATNSVTIAVPEAFPAHTMSELVSLAKARPGKLFLATSPPGTVPHVFAHYLVRVMGIEVTFVPYKSGLEGLTGLMRGDVQILLDSPAVMAPQAKSGTIRVLAATGHLREAELPDVPTIAEAGFPAAEYEPWIGLVAPSRTPSDIVARINREVAGILASPEIRQRLAALSFEPHSTTAEGFRELIRREHARWGPLIREAGIKLD
jgi:tripartite-type tricarboxylate transporter receptor subunit TctC